MVNFVVRWNGQAEEFELYRNAKMFMLIESRQHLEVIYQLETVEGGDTLQAIAWQGMWFVRLMDASEGE